MSFSPRGQHQCDCGATRSPVVLRPTGNWLAAGVQEILGTVSERATGSHQTWHDVCPNQCAIRHLRNSA